MLRHPHLLLPQVIVQHECINTLLQILWQDYGLAVLLDPFWRQHKQMSAVLYLGILEQGAP